QAYLAGVDGGMCLDDGCLAALAKTVNAGRALRISVAPFAPKLVLTATVVRADGIRLVALTGREYPKEPDRPLADSFHFAVRQLLAELSLDGRDVVPLVPVGPAPEAAKVALPGPDLLPWGLAAGGAAALGVGTWLQLDAAGKWNQL